MITHNAWHARPAARPTVMVGPGHWWPGVSALSLRAWPGPTRHRAPLEVRTKVGARKHARDVPAHTAKLLIPRLRFCLCARAMKHVAYHGQRLLKRDAAPTWPRSIHPQPC